MSATATEPLETARKDTSVEFLQAFPIDDLMDRVVAVMVVPYLPGIPVIMPGERITYATRSIQDYLAAQD